MSLLSYVLSDVRRDEFRTFLTHSMGVVWAWTLRIEEPRRGMWTLVAVRSRCRVQLVKRLWFFSPGQRIGKPRWAADKKVLERK